MLTATDKIDTATAEINRIDIKQELTDIIRDAYKILEAANIYECRKWEPILERIRKVKGVVK